MVGGGFSVSPSRYSPVNFRFDVSYSAPHATNYLLELSQQATDTAVDKGPAASGLAPAILSIVVPLAYGIRAHRKAGIGDYHERVELTQFNPYGGHYYCDPCSGGCAAGADTLMASRGVTKCGWNGGAGVEFALPCGQSWFIEGRNYRISTDTTIENVAIAMRCHL